MYVMKKIEIRLTKSQKEYALRKLYLLHSLWNDFVEVELTSLYDR